MHFNTIFVSKPLIACQDCGSITLNVRVTGNINNSGCHTFVADGSKSEGVNFLCQIII